MIKRAYDPLEKLLKRGRVLVIYGPRRVGKTTLLKNFLSRTKLKYRLDSGDNIRVHEILGSKDFKLIGEYVQGYDLIVIDEAQQIPGLGMGLKIIVDEHPKIQVLVTGSSSFDLAHQVGEPLTGRKRTITLYPISQLELAQVRNPFDLKESLEDFLIYGSYPQVVTAKGHKEKKMILQEIVSSYLFKDILALERLKAPKLLHDLLKLLAFQIGSEVSLNELSVGLRIDVKTVARYLDILEKSFVIMSLGGYGGNLRKEVTSKKKYYFLDTGIRNALIMQFNRLDLRNDAGQLWENFIVIERTKKRAYKNIFATPYFWRSYSQQEIDLIEETDGALHAYECKWSENQRTKTPSQWAESYPKSKLTVITPKNYLDFVS